jgi:hypothetical protein
MAGKSATIQVAFNQTDKLLAALPYIGTLLANTTLAGVTKVGTISENLSGLTQEGKQLIITERDLVTTWVADRTFVTDPQQIILASTQEYIAQVTFVVSVNSGGYLFSTVPSYIR